jgi:hypothetical protein
MGLLDDSSYTTDQVESYIRSAAAQRGIDPDQAVRVARSEGLNAYTGDNGSSFGPFQLHYGNVAPGGNAVSGLGDEFTKQTGLHASDPGTVKQQIDFSLDHAAQNGWGAWHGWKGDPWAGINSGGLLAGGAPAAAPQQQPGAPMSLAPPSPGPSAPAPAPGQRQQAPNIMPLVQAMMQGFTPRAIPMAQPAQPGSTMPGLLG